MSEKFKEKSKIGLQELLTTLREELLAAKAEIEPGKALLKIENVELELSFVTEKKGEAGIKFWVVNAGAKVGVQNTHKVKLKMTPLTGIDVALKK